MVATVKWNLLAGAGQACYTVERNYLKENNSVAQWVFENREK